MIYAIIHFAGLCLEQLICCRTRRNWHFWRWLFIIISLCSVASWEAVVGNAVVIQLFSSAHYCSSVGKRFIYYALCNNYYSLSKLSATHCRMWHMAWYSWASQS